MADHRPLETELIGAHKHESYYVFDICYHNTSDIAPTVMTYRIDRDDGSIRLPVM